MQLFTLLLLSMSCIVSSIDEDRLAMLAETNAEVEIRSEVHPSGDAMEIRLKLSQDANVGFALYTSQGDVVHQWRPKMILEGQHRLSLPLEEVLRGTYSLHVIVDGTVYKQLLYR